MSPEAEEKNEAKPGCDFDPKGDLEDRSSEEE